MVEIILAIILSLVVTVYYFMLRRNEQAQIVKFGNIKINQEENILHDAPTSNDKIGFNDYAGVLAENIKKNNNFCVYGIYGPWGSGKTSLLRMVRGKLENQRNIWFDAWKFKGKVSLFDALCEIVAEKLQEDLDSIRLKNQTFGLLRMKEKNKAGLKYNIRKLNNFNHNMSIIVDYLNSNEESKIVIYVDDLDRCNPTDAVEFLESLKVFFDIPRINFVIGVNYDLLYYEINKRYKDISNRNANFTEEYLAKIVNIPFFIPALDEKQIQDYIENNIKIQEVLDAAHIFAIGLDGNLRTIKRIVNSFAILLEVAKVRGIKISSILLAKILIIQYRYKEIYNKILLQPEYLLNIQESLFNEEIRYGRRRVIVPEHELEELPIELKKIMSISPMFDKQNLGGYINLSQDKQNDIRQHEEIKIQEYLEKIKNAKFDEVPDLRVFPVAMRKEIVQIIEKNFYTYETTQQLKAISLLGRIPNVEIEKMFAMLLENENVSLDVRLKIIIVSSEQGNNIEKSIWKLFAQFENYCIEDRCRILDAIIQLLRKGNRFCIDILDKMFDKINWNDYNDILIENVVKTLGESEDKKAIDIITRFLNFNDDHIIHLAFDAVAKLDVNTLWDWYEIYMNNVNHRGYYLSAIATHANKEDKIIRNISIEDMVTFLTNEKNEYNQSAAIKMIYLIAMKEIDDHDIFSGEPLNALVNIALKNLNHVARYDDKWGIRQEARNAIESIERYHRESIAY